MKKLILFFVIIFSNHVYSEEEYYLEGKLGKAKIYLHITEWNNGNQISATYFYQNSLKDIILEGKKENEKFSLAFQNAATDEIYERFELTKLSNTIFKGYWINNKSKKISLKLNSINFSEYKPNSIVGKDDDQLELIKLNFITFIKDSTSNYKGKNINWYSEKHCKVIFFRLGDNFSKTEKITLNPILDKIHRENAISQLSCSTRFGYSIGEGIEHTIEIEYLSPNLLGFEIRRYWDCGGAHPDFGSQGYLIDLNNGKNFEIDEIIAFDKSVTTYKPSNFDAYSEYRETYFAPGIYALIDKKEHFKKPAENDDESCDYTDLELWDLVSWNFTTSGIEFTPYFARYARSCEQPFLVPFSLLQSYKNPAFPYKLE